MAARVELIAYADRFGGDLAGLRGLLDGPLAGLFGGVHVLPFYRPFDGTDGVSSGWETPVARMAVTRVAAAAGARCKRPAAAARIAATSSASASFSR